ncbi:MAG TPA: VCBS repeat-containing protein, partial [Actinomycetota bacterium]|nr:VCBS repeat-containing protein [Actinomycetota bacterium]
ELEVADLEGDGAADIVAVTSIDGQAGRYRGDGSVVWEQPVETIIGATLALFDFDGDGTKDVVVGQKPWSGPGMLFVLDGEDGTQLWERQTNAGINWIDARPEHGILAGDLGGGLYRIGRGGEEIWFAAPEGGSSWDGEWTFDADSDRVPDVLTGQESGAVRVLSGADGQQIWAGSTEVGRAFAVDTIAGANGPQVAVGAFGASDQPFNSIVLLDGATGEQLGGAQTRYFVMDVTGAQIDEDPQEELAVASGWQLYMLDVG